MKIFLKQIENQKHKYIAYFNSPLGSASYVLFLNDDIFGAICLHTYLEILKKVFKTNKINIDICKSKINAKSILDIIEDQNMED